MGNNKKSSVETTTLKPVSLEEKRSWGSIAFIWMGSAICVPALMVGGLIGMGLPIGQAILAMIFGFVLVVIYMVLIGMQGSDLGVPTIVVFSRAFGERGSSVAVGLVIAICGVGWFAYQSAICGGSFVQILTQFTGISMPLWLSTLVWGLAMLATAVFGIKIIDILNKIAVPALLIMLVYGLIHALSQDGAADYVANYQPETPITFIAAATFAVSGFAVGAVLSSDYTRYCKSRRDTLLSSSLGIFPASILVLSIGGILAVTAGTYDLTIVFSSMGLPVIGLLCLILATWTTNCGNAYSGGIAIVGILKLKDDKRALATMVAGGIGIILAIIGVIDYFTSFLSFISVLVPPMAGATVADYWLKGKGDKKAWRPFKGVNWLGMISWAAGTAFGIAFNILIPTINAIVVAMIVYLILVNVVKSEKLNPFCAADYGE